MVGRSYSLNLRGVESHDLRIALYETKEDVQRLQEELDAEREASDSSTSEAMSMILRLQGEKAALAMEASQYRRMAEERMYHAELSLELLEDMCCLKEAEIKNLESRLYAYKSKLLSLGCRGTDDDHYSSDMRCCDDRSQTPSPEPFDTDVLVTVEKDVIEQSLDSSRRGHHEKNLDLYWDQIKKLDEQLKELTDFKDSLQTKNGEIGKAFAASSSNIQDVVTKVCKKSSKRKRNRSIKRDHVQGGFSANDQAELQRLRERVEQLERARCNTEPQTSEVKQEEELSYVQAEMKNSRSTEELLPCYDSAIVSVQEAMLYFWL
ncbi:GTD-binding domain-containing protein [Hirschfeldia incana]|nr:GTD-binding domain-containing protein [Hirschfeldia incana]